MVREVIQEVKEIWHEMPVFTAACLLLVGLCVGVRCAVFYEADGDELKLVADRNDAHAEMEEADPILRMHARAACPMKIPGFTVIVGLREYSMELSVPAASMRALLRPDVETRVAV